jgi:hypothetical protein
MSAGDKEYEAGLETVDNTVNGLEQSIRQFWPSFYPFGLFARVATFSALGVWESMTALPIMGLRPLIAGTGCDFAGDS